MLLYEYGEILTLVSIVLGGPNDGKLQARVMPMLTSVNISLFSYNNIFIIRLDHSTIMGDILTSELAVVICSKLVPCFAKRIHVAH